MSSILSNQYQVRFNPNVGINKYQMCNFSSEAIEACDAFDLIKENRPALQATLKLFIHLGNIIYTPTEVPEFNTEGFQLKHMGKLAIDAPEYQNLLSRFFKQVIRQQRDMVSVGNKAQKLFCPQKAVKHDDKNLVIWPGVECILTHHKLSQISALTIDCAFKVLRYKTAFQEMLELRQKNQIDRIVGEIVMTTYNKKFYKIERVNVTMNSKSTFKNEKEEVVSFAEYYKKRYNIDVKNLDAPLIEVTVREKNKGSKESLQRTIQLIPELCQMTGLTEEIKNNFHAMKAIATTTKPNGSTRIGEAAAFVKQLGQNIKGKDGAMKPNIFAEWGVQICPDALKFPEKQLPPGSLQLGGNKFVDIRTGNLDRDTQQPMYKNGQMARWAVFYCGRDEQQCQTFLQEIDKVNNDFQFGLQPPVTKQIADGRNQDQWSQAIDQVVQMAGGPQNIHFFMFILPGPKKKAPMYTPIKQICINKYPIPSQVILFDTIKNGKGLRSICNKLCVQIVSKTGGVPWAITDMPPLFSKVPTMIVGYDIFHKKSEQKPSQLAFCSTIDPQFGKYHSQDVPSGEFSTSLKALTEKAIQQFSRCNGGILPKNIVVFRDGASDGQEETVKGIEVAQFQQAIETTGQPIKLVFVLTNKRVSAKFYTSSFDNPQPGCVVDSKITQGNDFYLISQKTTQGTVTPTHYKILHNDLSAEQGVLLQIQSLSFKLCFLYYNWTGSIKVPGPVRYAHCFSNFIGERYLANDPKQFLPAEALLNRNTLFYI